MFLECLDVNCDILVQKTDVSYYFFQEWYQLEDSKLIDKIFPQDHDDTVISMQKSSCFNHSLVKERLLNVICNLTIFLSMDDINR